MNNTELDTLIVGFSIGTSLGTWLGYKLRRAIERAQAKRENRARKAVGKWREAYPEIATYAASRPDAGPREQKARAVPQRRQFIPLIRPSAGNGYHVPTDNERAQNGEFALLGIDAHDRERAVAAADEQRAEVVAALVGTGYKKVAAVIAVDACTLAERANGMEQWIVAALRRATTLK